MKNQFYYTRREEIAGTDPKEFKEFKDSININKIIRSVQMDDNTIVVLLDDIHQRSQEVPNVNLSTNQMEGSKTETQTLQTEVYLTGEDVTRFINATEI